MHDLDRQQLERYEQEGLLGERRDGERNETLEMELASELREITSEAELEQFLGDLLRRAKTAAKDVFATAERVAQSDLVQKHVIPVLKSAARHFDPAARAGGAPVAPGATAHIAADVTLDPDHLLKEEFEGLSGEDREFEIARRYIRFAIDALQRALQAPPRVPKPVAAEVAVSEAARTHVPGLVPLVPQLVLEASSGDSANGGARSGRWVRRGTSIVIDLG